MLPTLQPQVESLQAALNQPAGDSGDGFTGLYYQTQRPPTSGSFRTGPSAPNQPMVQAVRPPPALNREAAFAPGAPQANPYMVHQQGVDAQPAVWYNDTGQPQARTLPTAAPSGGLSPDIANALAKAHGLGQDHAGVMHQLLQAGAPVSMVLDYAAHALKGRQETAASELDYAKAQEAYQQTAANYEAQNAYGAGGLKGHEADQRLAGEQANIAMHEREGEANRRERASEHNFGTAQPTTELTQVSAAPPNPDRSQAGQVQNTQDFLHAQALNHLAPPHAGAPIPAAVQAQYRSAFGGDWQAAQRAAEAAGWR